MRPSDARRFAIKIARQFDLKVRLVAYLPETVLGTLLPREKRILVNARKPLCEQVFTILHECGHFLLHVQRRVGRLHQNWLLDRIGGIGRLEALVYKVRRVVRFAYNKEKEADLWAMCAFVAIAPADGRVQLAAFLERRPEKLGLFLMVAAATFYSNWKKRLSNLLARV